MFEHITFDVDIARRVDGPLVWPPESSQTNGFLLGGNYEFHDLRHILWADADKVVRDEAALILRIEEAEDPDEEIELIEQEQYEDPDLLIGVDLGVASTVAVLSAASCLTIASCNGGAFGGDHHEDHPLVVFYARSEHLIVLLEAAEAADVGLERDAEGYLMVYAGDIRRMIAFSCAFGAAYRRHKEVE